MSEFVRFRVNDAGRFEALRKLFLEVKKDKDADHFRSPEKWTELIPVDVRPSFEWPSVEQCQAWLTVRSTTSIAIGEPASNIGQRWNFYSIFEAFENGEYSILDCVKVTQDVAEMRIDASSYPYGGLGCMIALAEAFGFKVLGVDECGRYEEFSK